MSILQEYEQIRRDLGEETYAKIEAFLADHEEYFLSDVYYKPEVFAQCCKEQGIPEKGEK